MKAFSKKESMKDKGSKDVKEKPVNCLSYSPLIPQGYPLYLPPFFPFGTCNPGVLSMGPGYIGNPNRYSGGQRTPYKTLGPCFLCKES